MDINSLVVRPHRPVRARIIAGTAVLAILVAGWLLFEYGRYQAGYDLIEVLDEQQLLQEEIDSLNRALSEQREKSAIMERSSQIDRQANTVVKGSVLDLQNEILELKAELAFYRGIVAPDEGKVGVRIQSLKLFGAGAQRHFRYNLMLTQVLKGSRLARGKVVMVVDGLEDGAPRRLSLKAVIVSGKADPKYRFKYFQSIEGELKLPDNYVPQSVTIDVVPSSNRLPKVSKSFEWVTEG